MALDVSSPKHAVAMRRFGWHCIAVGAACIALALAILIVQVTS